MTPAPRHIISFSGGVCSFWAAHRVVAKHGRDGVVLLFADTSMEDPDLYRFNRDVEGYLEIPLVRVADGRTPWEVFRDERMIGNTRVDLCSRILKRDILWRWIRANAQPSSEVTIHFGMEAHEKQRLARVRSFNKEWNIQAPMMRWPIWDKCRMLAELEALGLEAPRLYSLGFPHNNCGGFCVKAGQAHFAHLLKVMPETYAYHEAQEQKVRLQLGKEVAILRDRRGGATRPMTLAQLRARVEGGEKINGWEWGGCGCAIDP